MGNIRLQAFAQNARYHHPQSFYDSLEITEWWPPFWNLLYEKITESTYLLPICDLLMPLYFRDVFGARGKISDSLGVSYTGHWEEDIEDFVEGMGDDGLIGDGGPDRLDELGYLAIDLPEEFPIREISREDS